MTFDIEMLLKKIPRPDIDELENMYNDLDEMARKAFRILAASQFYDNTTAYVHFEKMSEEDLYNLMKLDPEVMIPLFVMFCGLSIRELESLFSVKNVYELRRYFNTEKGRDLAKVLKRLLNNSFNIETVIYKFYKNWEEHQKRHYRAKIEEDIRQYIRQHGYKCEKIRLGYLEVDGAIPPDPKKCQVVLQIRLGVMRDIRKRAKEFSSEFDYVQKILPEARFVVIYIPRSSERNLKERIRQIILEERKGKKPYDLVILGREELDELIRKLEEWKVPKQGNGQ